MTVNIWVYEEERERRERRESNAHYPISVIRCTAHRFPAVQARCRGTCDCWFLWSTSLSPSLSPSSCRICSTATVVARGNKKTQKNRKIYHSLVQGSH